MPAMMLRIFNSGGSTEELLLDPADVESIRRRDVYVPGATRVLDIVTRSGQKWTVSAYGTSEFQKAFLERGRQ